MVVSNILQETELARNKDIIWLNVGGRRFVISSQIIIGKHHDSLFARAYRESCENFRCETDGSSSISTGTYDVEVFIDGNVNRFEYCLDYIIKGRVVLPPGVSKMAVLDDLDYYDIKVPNPGAVKVDDKRQADCTEASSTARLPQRLRKDEVLLQAQEFPTEELYLILQDLSTLMKVIARRCADASNISNELILRKENFPLRGAFGIFRNEIVRGPQKSRFNEYLREHSLRLTRASNFRKECTLCFASI